MLPSFIVIGAMKTGTSSLYQYIASHPDVVPSAIKETNFFKNSNNFNKGVGYYESLFITEGKVAFEASPSYTKRHLFPDVPARIQSVLPDVQLIYVLRDPIARAISHYMHNYADGRESRSFSDAVIDAESNYVQTSKYYYQIEAFLDYFSEKQLLLIESERLQKDSVGVVNDVFNFVGLKSEYNSEVLENRFHVSREKKRKSSLENILVRRTNNPQMQNFIRSITAPLRKSIERPNISTAEKNALVETLAPDIEKLRRFSGLEFSNWSL